MEADVQVEEEERRKMKGMVEGWRQMEEEKEEVEEK